MGTNPTEHMIFSDDSVEYTFTTFTFSGSGAHPAAGLKGLRLSLPLKKYKIKRLDFRFVSKANEKTTKQQIPGCAPVLYTRENNYVYLRNDLNINI